MKINKALSLLIIFVIITIILIFLLLQNIEISGNSHGHYEKSVINSFIIAIYNFMRDNNRYPTKEEGLVVLLPYFENIKTIPKDSWVMTLFI